jgi:hypothetical protein
MIRRLRPHRESRQVQPLRSLSGRQGTDAEVAPMPPIHVTNAMNGRIREVEEQLEAEYRADMQRLQEQEGTTP